MPLALCAQFNLDRMFDVFLCVVCTQDVQLGPFSAEGECRAAAQGPGIQGGEITSRVSKLLFVDTLPAAAHGGRLHRVGREDGQVRS